MAIFNDQIHFILKRIYSLTLLSLLLSCYVNAQADECACCTPNHIAFGFWVGDWEVFQDDGTLVGTNKIIKDQDNCILRENWVSSKGGFTGSSTNFYNKQSGQWEQLWIDNTGLHLHLKGNRIGNQMIMLTDEIPAEDTSPYVNRITWTSNDDGTVTQLWEILVDEKVTQIVFNGIYKKKS